MEYREGALQSNIMVDIENENHETSPTKREKIHLSRADNMKKVREEQLKMSNDRKRVSTRDSPDLQELTTKQKEVKHMGAGQHHERKEAIVCSRCGQ